MSLLDIPSSLLIKIGCYLEYDDIPAFAQSHRYLAQAVRSEAFWIKRYQRDFYFLVVDRLARETGKPFTYHRLYRYLFDFKDHIIAGFQHCADQCRAFQECVMSYNREPLYFDSYFDQSQSRLAVWGSEEGIDEEDMDETRRIYHEFRIDYTHSCPPFAIVDNYPVISFWVLLQVTYYNHDNTLCVIVEVESIKDDNAQQLQEIKIASFGDINVLFHRVHELGYIPLYPRE